MFFQASNIICKAYIFVYVSNKICYPSHSYLKTIKLVRKTNF